MALIDGAQRVETIAASKANTAERSAFIRAQNAARSSKQRASREERFVGNGGLLSKYRRPFPLEAWKSAVRCHAPQHNQYADGG